MVVQNDISHPPPYIVFPGGVKKAIFNVVNRNKILIVKDVRVLGRKSQQKGTKRANLDV